GQSSDDTEWGERSPLLSFSNTDMAFSGDKMATGSYHGFNVYQLQEDGLPKLFSSVVCPGGQGDISIVGDLLIMSVEQTRGRVDCGLQGVSEDVSPVRFRGIRIFDISDMERPRQVGQVQTCRGSHTHSIVSGPDDDGKIIVYNSGTSSVRKGEELDGCVGDIAGDERTAMFRIDVIEIPIDDPSKSRIVSSPAVFADPETGRLAGLWQGGDHGDETQESSVTNQCHDITVFPELGIAGGACSGNGIIFDISDPLNPTRMDEVVDDGFAYWHSATFNNDGTKVIFTDEWGGGSRPRCRTYDPKDWGADAIYNIVDGKLEFQSYYKLPAPQVEQENCVAHNGSVIPVPGRDIFAQAWYQGGLSVVDFTDSANPIEIAYFDRGPIHEEHLVLGGYWSTYWYNGKIYGTEIARGMDVLSILPSEHLSENEIAAAMIANQGEVFNPQQQFRMTWPADPVVAGAYIDQLQRSNSLSDSDVAALNTALDQSSARLEAGGRDRKLSRNLRSLAANLDSDGGDAATNKRRAALAETLDGIAARLR
ncbi:MAG: LVIVD repeat-containing protein, partial [Woeseiales bacterium]